MVLGDSGARFRMARAWPRKKASSFCALSNWSTVYRSRFFDLMAKAEHAESKGQLLQAISGIAVCDAYDPESGCAGYG